MPSRQNPNVPSKARKVASRAKVQKRASVSRTSKNARGTATSSVLHPTSGPAAPVSGKKAKKLERARKKALKRGIEEEMRERGEVVMTDAPKVSESKKTKGAEEKADEQMDVDIS